MPLRYKCALLGGQYYESDFRDDVGRIDLFVKLGASLKRSSEGVSFGQKRQYRWRNIGGWIAANGLKYDQGAVQSMAKMANQVNQVSAKWKVTAQQLNTNFTKQLEWFLATKVGELYEQIRIMEAMRKNYDKLKKGKNPAKATEMGELFMAHKTHVQTLIDKVKVEMEVFKPAAYAWIAAEQDFNAFAKEALSIAGSIPTKSTYDRLANYKKDKAKQAREKSLRSSRSARSNKSSKRRVISIKVGGKRPTTSVMMNPDSNSAKSSKSKMSAPGGKSQMGSVAKSQMAPVDSSAKSAMKAPTGKSMMGSADDASEKNNNKSKATASKMAPVETSGKKSKVRKGKSKAEGKSVYKSVASQPEESSGEGSKMKEPMEGSKEKSNEEKSKSGEAPK